HQGESNNALSPLRNGNDQTQPCRMRDTDPPQQKGQFQTVLASQLLLKPCTHHNSQISSQSKELILNWQQLPSTVESHSHSLASPHSHPCCQNQFSFSHLAVYPD